MGFLTRTNLFKWLESSGSAFIQSIERHILRNFIYLYAIDQNFDIPIGTQDADLLDTRNSDEDADQLMRMEKLLIDFLIYRLRPRNRVFSEIKGYQPVFSQKPGF